MQRWNWVMSADVGGRFITTQGYAEVELDELSVHATLRYGSGVNGVYHWLEGSLDSGDLQVTVRSRAPEAAAFQLGGTVFRGEPDRGIRPMMILLTDGATVLSLAHGPHSHMDNL
jgi:hypothetical protein